MPYIKNKQVKLFIKGMEFRVSKDALMAIDRKVEELIKKAIEKTKAAKRKTVSVEDVE